jgi:hypothetical protein
MRKFFSLALITTALLLGGCAKSPESTVEEFYRAVENGDYEKARSLIASEQRADGIKLGFALSIIHDEIKKCGSIRSIKTADLHREGEYLVGETKLEFSGKCGSLLERESEIKIKQEDGKWVLVLS